MANETTEAKLFHRNARMARIEARVRQALAEMPETVGGGGGGGRGGGKLETGMVVQVTRRDHPGWSRGDVHYLEGRDELGRSYKALVDIREPTLMLGRTLGQLPGRSANVA